MSAKTFGEWRQLARVAEMNGMDVAAESHRLLADMLEQRAALLADRPEVMEIVDLVDDIVTAARLTQFYEDPIHKPWSEPVWRSVDTARRTISTRRKRLESLAAQLAQRDEEIAKLKAHSEAMADAIQFGDMAILTVAKAAAESYRSDYPKGPK